MAAAGFERRTLKAPVKTSMLTPQPYDIEIDDEWTIMFHVQLSFFRSSPLYLSTKGLETTLDYLIT